MTDSRRPPLYPYRDRWPEVHPEAFVAPTAALIGAVTIGAKSSVWFGTVLRGDVEPIRIGARTSVQDNTVIHATGGFQPTTVGDDVTVGHAVILHGCTVGDGSLIGMGSVVLDGAEVGNSTILGAGSLVPPNKTIPSGVLALGRPAKVVRELTEAELKDVMLAASTYVGLVADYK